MENLLIQAIALIIYTLANDNVDLSEIKKSDFIEYVETQAPKAYGQGRFVAVFFKEIESDESRRYIRVSFYKEIKSSVWEKSKLKVSQNFKNISLAKLTEIVPLKFLEAKETVYYEGQVPFYKYRYEAYKYDKKFIIELDVSAIEHKKITQGKLKYPSIGTEITFYPEE